MGSTKDTSTCIRIKTTHKKVQQPNYRLYNRAKDCSTNHDRPFPHILNSVVFFGTCKRKKGRKKLPRCYTT